MTERPEVDLYKILEPVLLRPAMFFGRKEITSFFHFYMGLTLLTDDRFGPVVYKPKHDLFAEGGFVDWLREKKDWARNVVTSYHYICAAREKLEKEGYCVASVSPHKVEEVGFDLFVADLKEFRERT